MSVLKVKNANGEWVSITSIKGEKGDKGDPGGISSEEFASVGEAAADAEIKAEDALMQLHEHQADKNNPHGITAEQIGAAGAGHTHSASEVGAATAELYMVTIPVSGWSGSVPYMLDVTVSGILETDVPVIDVVLPDDASEAKKIIEEWAKVGRITTAANKITVYCYEEKPSVALPIQLKVVR